MLLCVIVGFVADQRRDEEANFAENLRLLRDRQGLSQGQLAARLSKAGVPGIHQTTISRIESGERPVRLGEALALARDLHVPVSAMVDEPRVVTLQAKLRQRAQRLVAAKVSVKGRFAELMEARDALRVATQDALALGIASDPEAPVGTIECELGYALQQLEWSEPARIAQDAIDPPDANEED